MATFTFGRAIDIHWNGYDIQGTAGTVFSIPDQLYEEFDADIAPVEPTLVWIDTNEFLTLSNSVSVTTLTGTIPISVTTTTSGKVVAISSTTNPAGYNLVADGTGGVIFQAGSTGALTSVVGISPISSIISGNTVSVILNANYQTAGSYQASGNYASSVSATLPISASISTAGAVSISIDTTGFQSAGSYQASGTYVNAVIGTSPASVSTASGTSTVSIVAGSINSTHLSATSVGSSQLIAQAVGTAALSSGAAANGTVLTANGSGAASFSAISAPSLTVAQNAQTASYTLVLTDQDKLVEMNAATALNITVPPNSSVAFPTGAQVHVLQVGAGQVTVVAGTGVTVNSSDGLKLRTQWSPATLIKRATNTWVLMGDNTP